jgi:hypothetical protein
MPHNAKDWRFDPKSNDRAPSGDNVLLSTKRTRKLRPVSG